jgi:hypothetical protein
LARPQRGEPERRPGDRIQQVVGLVRLAERRRPGPAGTSGAAGPPAQESAEA